MMSKFNPLTLLRTIAVAGLVILSFHGASGSTSTALYSFCTKANCRDGDGPVGSLLMDKFGTLYGVTVDGGAHTPGGGTVFALTPNGGSWEFQTLYSFCAKQGCPDGHNPFAGLIIDVNGNLYGTTENGGTPGGGTVFELIPNADRTKWKHKILHNFCFSCSDGEMPNSTLTYQGASTGVPYDGVSPLYGATSNGGSGGWGTVFTLSPAPHGSSWKETVVYTFCPTQDCTDGKEPSGGLILDAAGNLFVDTEHGGDADSGTINELSPVRKTWKETQLYSFCAAAKCKDGAVPLGQLTLDSAGNLIGTAGGGGDKKEGVLFELSPQGSGYTESVLYSFCPKPHCVDGRLPLAGVTLDTDGSLVGVASAGGSSSGAGTLFRFNSTFEVLCTFGQSPCVNGFSPGGVPLLDGKGNIFGVTGGGGDFNHGMIYEVTP